MEHGTVIASICFEKIMASGEKKHIPIGKLIYFRAHKENSEPSAQFRWDLCPATAWTSNPDTWFIGNFESSEKIPDAPYLDGDIFVTSDVLKDHVVIGHIKTRQRDHNDDTQYYMQLHGIPMGAVIKQHRHAFLRVVEMWLSIEGKFSTENSTATMMENLKKLFAAKRKSLYCNIEM